MTSGLQGHIALVTGASRGIGRAIAVELAGRGVHVIAFARNRDSLAPLEAEIAEMGAAMTPFFGNVTDARDIQRLAGYIFETWQRLDILIGNAAIMGPRTTLAELDDADWQDVIDTNVTANWRLIRRMDPLLREAEAGRAIFITSGSGSKGELAPGRGAYALSKTTLDAIARTYAAETAGTPIRVMLCNPGPTRTDMRASIMPDEDPMSLKTPADFAAKVADMCTADWQLTGKLYDFPQDRILSFRGPD
ncbi:MAG: short-chain dehydrogenase/reductase [Hyphomicrobiales bacterium]|jgi:NAD(P)-dependent dehydrogenase (short-subunit alcohol dehydrogenase family)|nr:short-chain dehydrogenase/reductase [Hyphomicrobiales bacterium]